MSESSSGAVSVTLSASQDPLRQQSQGLSRGAEKALALCLKAVAQEADHAQCGETLEVLETLLPELGSSEIDALISEPGYCAIRKRLLRIRAETWFIHECELARRALDHDPASALRSLFGHHIPRQAYADELAVLRPLRPRNILILGSGACPMSAVVIQDAFPMSTVVGLDRSRGVCVVRSSTGGVQLQRGEDPTRRSGEPESYRRVRLRYHGPDDWC